ncbi:MAG: T9SS type A sorting domain-containing protein [candidate division Zixibacteria bacterium]|nr:T9SS type A sorting domain-containing protein [candidate division Zixibacteria bacterium]
MKCKLIMLLSVLLLSWGMVHAVGDAQVDLRVVGDTIFPEVDQTLDFWVANDSLCGGIQLPFELSSTDGVTWAWLTQPTGWGTSKYITHVVDSRVDPPATVFDLTGGFLVLEGGLPSALGVGGGTGAVGTGMAAGPLQHILSAHFDTEVQDTGVVHTLCVDMNVTVGPFSFAFTDFNSGFDFNTTFLDANGDAIWCFPVMRPLAAGDARPNTPAVYSLSQNYPNPFNPTTVINYSMERKGKINISIFNILGQHVKTLVDAEVEAGANRVTWEGTDQDGSGVASGVYFYKMTTDKYVETRKMTLMR